MFCKGSRGFQGRPGKRQLGVERWCRLGQKTKDKGYRIKTDKNLNYIYLSMVYIRNHRLNKVSCLPELQGVTTPIK